MTSLAPGVYKFKAWIFPTQQELTLVALHLKKAPFPKFCGDVVMGSDTPSIEHTDIICNEPLGLTPISSPLLPTTPSHLHAFHESLGDIRCYNPSFDTYCAYLKNVPIEIMWSTFFDHSFDFSMAFDEFKRPLTFLPSFFVVFSYLNHFDMHAVTCNKLLRALTHLSWGLDSWVTSRSG